MLLIRITFRVSTLNPQLGKIKCKIVILDNRNCFSYFFLLVLSVSADYNLKHFC